MNIRIKGRTGDAVFFHFSLLLKKIHFFDNDLYPFYKIGLTDKAGGAGKVIRTLVTRTKIFCYFNVMQFYFIMMCKQIIKNVYLKMCYCPR